MKKIIISMAFYAIMIASCSKETVDPTLNQTLNTSTAMNAGLVSNSTDESNALELRGGHRPPGKDNLACKRIPLDQLLQTIKDYVATNYVGATIEFALKDRAGNFYTILKLADGSIKILQFDSNGNFVKELDRKVPRPRNPKDHLTKIDPASLLPAIISYIDANYAGSTIAKAGSTPNGEFIVLISENGVHKALLFDANGNFIKELK